MWLIKNLTRHSRKNLLLILVVFVISVLFFISTAIRENSSSQIRNFLSTYKVTAYYMKKESFFTSRPGGAWLAAGIAEVPLQFEDLLSTYSFTRTFALSAGNAAGDKQTSIMVLALTDLTMVNRPELAEAEMSGYTNDDFKIYAEDSIAIISSKLSDVLDIAIGDTLVMTDSREVTTEFKVCGIFSSETSEAVVPIAKTGNIYAANPNVIMESGEPYMSNDYDTNLYVLKDTNYIRDFKLAMSQEKEFRNTRFVVDDAALTETVRPLKTTIDYVDKAIIMLLVISILIAFIISFILLKSRSAEIAIMYCIGLPKTKIFFTLFAELAVTTLAAIFVGAVVGFVVSLTYIGATNLLESLNRLLLLFMSFSLGATASIISSIAIKPMDILTKKEG